MQDSTKTYRILRKLEKLKMFRVDLLRLNKGEPVTLNDWCETTDKPMCVARFTELCDEYYEADLTADDLLLLAEEMQHLADKLKCLEQEQHQPSKEL